jgi:hypothetical protein
VAVATSSFSERTGCRISDILSLDNITYERSEHEQVCHQ